MMSKNVGPQTRKALEMIAQIERIQTQLEQVRAEQAAAHERRELLAAQVKQLKAVKAWGERQRAKRTARARGNYLFN